MIALGVLVLVVALLVWAVGEALAGRPPARVLLIAGRWGSIIGAVILVVGLVLLLIDGLSTGGLDVDAAKALAGVVTPLWR